MATTFRRNSAAPPVPRTKIGVFATTVAFLFFYMIAFPKGGIKAGDVPLTIGYAFTPVLALLVASSARTLAIPIDRLLAAIPCLLLTLWSFIIVRINGYQGTGALISYFVTIAYLPIFGLITFSAPLFNNNQRLIERTFVWAFRFIVLYGIFLFIFRQTTGHWIEIPYVTVNAGDVGQLDDKYIDRGGIFKLISTYNNGNIFGLCTIMMAPLYLTFENKKILKIAMYGALFLTLSRTIWIGMTILFVVRSLTKGIRPLSLLYMIVGVLFGMIILYFLLDAVGLNLAFLTDRNLGGRVNQFSVLQDIRIIPAIPFKGLPEIVYLGMLDSFGVPGLLLFVAFLGAPPLLLWLEGALFLGVTPASACMQGMVLYMIMACADAAFGLIPVMMIFWMIAGMGFWYAAQQAKLQGSLRAAAG